MYVTEKTYLQYAYNRKLNMLKCINIFEYIYIYIYIYVCVCVCVCVFLPSVGLVFVSGPIWSLSSKYFECNSSRNCTSCSYIQHGLVGNRNKFPSCQCELLISWGNGEDQSALKWDRSSYPFAAPGCFSHHLRLKYLGVIG